MVLPYPWEGKVTVDFFFLLFPIKANFLSLFQNLHVFLWI